MNLRVFYLTRRGLSDGYILDFRFGASCRQIFALVRSAFYEALG